MQYDALRLFKDLVSFQSVSTDPRQRTEILKTVAFLSTQLKKIGFEVRIFKAQKAPPLIIAVKKFPGASKTLGFYGHYDVQPEDPSEEWNSPPFVLTRKNGKLIGRGTADDKGHVVSLIAAAANLAGKRRAPQNLVFVFEGEEESSSEHFEYLIKKALPVLDSVDAFYVMDMGMHAKGIPKISYALRGLVYFELTVRTGKQDFHSGVFGNRVYNPVQLLSELFAKIKNSTTGRILIPGFYDNMTPVSAGERKLLGLVERNATEEKNQSGAFALCSVDNEQPSISSKRYPSFDVNGIISGYTGTGAKTIIPHEARAKFSFRLVEKQDAQIITALVQSFIKKEMPRGIQYSLRTFSSAQPFFTDYRNEYVVKTSKILSSVFGHKTLLNRSGGSVPAAEILQRIFKKPIVLLGFTLPDCKIHAPNENVDEEMFWSGIRALQEICCI